jgi:hypothetical protein
MNKAGFLFLGAVMSLGSLGLVLTGCGGDDSNGTGGAGGTTASSSSTSGASSSSTSGASSSSGGTTAATCTSYCTANLAACTADNGQYKDQASCEKACMGAAFPQGAIGATKDNSLECRVYHTNAAKTAAAMHCGHSGLNGGDLDPKTAGGPVCGDGVEPFCALAVATCTGANQVWADAAACKTDMATIAASTTPFSITKDVAGNNFDCRVYHLLAAVTAPDMHCAHIKVASDVCK